MAFFNPCLCIWNNLIAVSCPWPPYHGLVKDTPPINHCRFKKWVTGDLKRNLKKKKRKNALHAGCLTNAWPRVFVLCSPLRYILVQFYQHFSPSFQSCWKQHFEWEDEVCPFSCMLSLTTPAPPLPAYIHTSFNSNRKSKRREKEKVPSLSIFSCVPSVINHWAFSLHQDRFHLHMPQHPSWDSDNTLMFCAE